MSRTRHVTALERTPTTRRYRVDDVDALGAARTLRTRELRIDLEPGVAPSPDRLDAALVALAPEAAYDGRALVGHGVAEIGLLDGLAAWIRESAAGRPDLYSVVGVGADLEVAMPSPPPDAPAIAAFAGTLEDAHTVVRQLRPAPGDRVRRLAALALVVGLELPPDPPLPVERLTRDSAAAAAELDPALRLVTLETSVRAFLPAPLWDADPRLRTYERAALLLEVGGEFPIGLLGAAGAASLPSPADNPVHVDAPYASTLARAREVTRWPGAVKLLRPCPNARSGMPNCGRCEACVRVIAAFRALGRDAVSTLGNPGDGVFRAVKIGDADRAAWHEIVDAARVRTPGTWVDAVRQALGDLPA